MKVDVEELEPTKVKLTITADLKDVKQYLDKAHADIAKQVAVPGFRKGHVPAQVIDARYGFPAVYSQALNDAVPELYGKAVSEKKLVPMNSPKLAVEKMPESASDKQPLVYTAEVEIRPAFDLKDPAELKLSIPAIEVSDDEIAQRLEDLRQRFGTLVSVDRPAKKGDFVTIDLTAKIGDETVDSQSGVSYEIGSNTMLDGLDDAVTDLSAGEETTFESELPNGAHKGEKATVKVAVNSVKEEQLPELDDDFAQEASEFDTLDELKGEIRKQAEAGGKMKQAEDARDAMLAALEDGLDIPVPTDLKASTVESNIANGGKDKSKLTDDEKKKIEDDVEKQIRDQMVLEKLGEDLAVEVTQADVFNFLATVAQQYGMEPQRFISAVVNNGQLDAAISDVSHQKALVAAMRKATFLDPDGKEVDFGDLLGEDEAAESSDSDASVKAAETAAAVADQITEDSKDAKPAKKASAKKSTAKKTATKSTAKKTAAKSTTKKASAKKSDAAEK